MTKIIVDLDGLPVGKAFALAKKFAGTKTLFKVCSLVEQVGSWRKIAKLGKYNELFFDLKLHDIPKTVERRAGAIVQYRPTFLTVHACGGIPMIRAAAENSEKTKILAVTILTSMKEEDCQINLGGTITTKIFQYAMNAVAAGADGIVCSVWDLEFLSCFSIFDRLIKVTPGIRPAWYQNNEDDQERTATPAEAVLAGSDYIVVGRPISKAIDPMQALNRIKDEMVSISKIFHHSRL